MIEDDLKPYVAAQDVPGLKRFIADRINEQQPILALDASANRLRNEDGEVAVLTTTKHGGWWASKPEYGIDPTDGHLAALYVLWLDQADDWRDEQLLIAAFHESQPDWRVEASDLSRLDPLRAAIRLLIGDPQPASIEAWPDLDVEWLPPGTSFTLSEHDGLEEIQVLRAPAWTA